MLRQNISPRYPKDKLMRVLADKINSVCNDDMGVISHQWIAVDVEPFANFNTWHKCRDMAAVEAWIYEHENPHTPLGSNLPIPFGSKIYAEPP